MGAAISDWASAVAGARVNATMEKPFRSPAASPATTKRVWDSRGVCSRFRLSSRPVLNVRAFCEGADLPGENVPSIRAKRRAEQGIARTNSHVPAFRGGTSRRAPSAMADPVRPLARLTRISSKRCDSTSEYSRRPREHRAASFRLRSMRPARLEPATETCAFTSADLEVKIMLSEKSFPRPVHPAFPDP